MKHELIQADKGENGKSGSGSFKTLINILLGEQHVPRNQAFDVLKMVLTSLEGKEDLEVCEIFYASHFERLVGALKEPKPVPHKLQLVLDLLALCACHKKVAISHYTRAMVIPAALPHLQTRDKVVLIGVIKFIRELVREEVFQSLVIKEKLLWKLKPLLEASQPLNKVLQDDNLVTGAVIELFDSLLIKNQCDLTRIASGDENPKLAPNREELVRHILFVGSPYKDMDHPVVERLQKALDNHQQMEEQRKQYKLRPEDFCVPGEEVKDEKGRRSFRERLDEERYFDDDDDEPVKKEEPVSVKHDYFGDAPTVGPAAPQVKLEPADDAAPPKADVPEDLAADLEEDFKSEDSGSEDPPPKKPRTAE